MTEADIEQALEVELDTNDAGAADVRGYLAILLITVMEEKESFSGKRPFGNSGWQYDLTAPLRAAGFNPDEEDFWRDLIAYMCGVEFEQ